MVSSTLRVFSILILAAGVAWAGLQVGRGARSDDADATSSHPLHETELSIGDPFPDVALTARQGERLAFAEFRGRPTLVCLLAIGCDPCSGAVDLLLEAQPSMPPELRVVGVGMQDYNQLVDYQAETGFPYAIYADPDRVLALEYGCKRFPAAIGVTSDGTIAFIREGLGGFAAALEMLDRLVATGTEPRDVHSR